jgi:[acyl-carrier-protein] S-malonyltransferase
MSLALLFPGQGSQAVGMGRSLADAHPEAAETFQEADDILGFGLSELMWEGPEEELIETRNAQPALLTHSVAVVRVLGSTVDAASVAAGHSLGEFSAHVAAGTLSFADALQAVRLRGRLMFEAGEARPGTMAAILGLDDDTVREVCVRVSTDGSTVVPANLNSPGQVVISGDLDAVDRAMVAAGEAGARRTVPLNVSGAFHSPLMKPAREGLREGLDAVKFDRPRFPIISNVLAAPVTDGDRARELLIEQLTSPVRWAESVHAMVEQGVDRFLELGTGSVLTGLNRRNAKGVSTTPVGTAEDVEGLDL